MHIYTHNTVVVDIIISSYIAMQPTIIIIINSADSIYGKSQEYALISVYMIFYLKITKRTFLQNVKLVYYIHIATYVTFKMNVR